VTDGCTTKPLGEEVDDGVRRDLVLSRELLD
jgi:hypothetical protein